MRWVALLQQMLLPWCIISPQAQSNGVNQSWARIFKLRAQWSLFSYVKLSGCHDKLANLVQKLRNSLEFWYTKTLEGKTEAEGAALEWRMRIRDSSLSAMLLFGVLGIIGWWHRVECETAAMRGDWGLFSTHVLHTQRLSATLEVVIWRGLKQICRVYPSESY